MPPNAVTFMTVSRQFLPIIKRRGLYRTIQAPVSRGFHFSVLTQKASSTMQTPDSRGDHLERTSNKSRDAGIHPMKVKAINVLSPTVKEIVLGSEDLPAPFTFKAGQWVDVFIPGIETVGGFSMCSSPVQLSSSGLLRLAIKYSTHPPALWMHEKCQLGDNLAVRVGGDFHLTLGNDKGPKRLLLIAGGVGINPLTSMVHYALDESFTSSRDTTKIYLLYSAKTKDELIFKEEFDNYSNTHSNFAVKYFVTDKSQLTPETGDDTDTTIQNKRMCTSDLEFALDWLTQSVKTKSPINADVEAFICGPPSMIQDVTEELNSLNIKTIHFEKWW